MAPAGDGSLNNLSARVKRAALDLGFATCGIADLSATLHPAALDTWIDAGMAGTMGYMPRQAHKRKNPAEIVPGATRAIVLTRFYPPEMSVERPLDGAGRVASYARGPDYHATLQPSLDELAAIVRKLGDDKTIARPFVDAGPVPERELAQRAGLGWIGKNTMLIDPQRGSFCFIASVLTNLDLAPDPPFQADRCGTCRRCLDACPTDAFPEARVLDARRCISYLTIEWRGDLDPALVDRFDGWAFGCDICQSVCPWNVRFSGDPVDQVLGLSADRATIDLHGMSTISDKEFAVSFGKSPMSRPGPAGMRRNANALLDASDQRPVG